MYDLTLDFEQGDLHKTYKFHGMQRFFLYKINVPRYAETANRYWNTVIYTYMIVSFCKRREGNYVFNVLIFNTFKTMI